MPRVAGIDVPGDKVLWVSLTYIYGIGPATGRKICAEVGLNPQMRARELTEDMISRLNAYIDENFPVEGQLRQQVLQNINRLKKIQCYRGIRHIRGLPVRGQRTRTNARTRKGRKKTVAVKRGVKDIH
ncbi:MAG TPA: 30S ribosomal protein S13 [Planctomycetes bacterium]|nr:30S ribosomal protein S13 [Planctomycetota bacterium]